LKKGSITANSDNPAVYLKKIIIAEYYGFCMGVERAISITKKTKENHSKVTILNEIVHNDAVVNDFARSGVGRALSISDIKDGTVIISAHGVSPDVYAQAEAQGLNIVNATCPLVIRIHKIIKKLADDGYFIIHFGDSEHDETIGILGHAPDKMIVISESKDLKSIGKLTGKVALTSQTTAHVADFVKIEKAVRKKYPKVEIFNTICNATNQRQAAIIGLAPMVDMMLVVGSKTSANSKRLAQISKTFCKTSYLINSAEDIKVEWFKQKGRKIETVGLSAGASTPDFLIEGAIKRLKKIATGKVEIIHPGKKARINQLVLKEDPI
jgi:4-hydroxy-3-methylbut-2-en-1-yl diphosphate reductase